MAHWRSKIAGCFVWYFAELWFGLSLVRAPSIMILVCHVGHVCCVDIVSVTGVGFACCDLLHTIPVVSYMLQHQ